MVNKLERLGSRLLGLFVEEVEASACGWYCYNDCWQCAHSACKVNTCNGDLVCLSGRC
ncbi:hypothetical protein [Amycolatopsis pigmentata]|uniref:Acetyltransferase n=1 Tax=Amycolatopsis pigmentata TaxID=450801 RepID=A0ABW5FS67_9PSEU